MSFLILYVLWICAVGFVCWVCSSLIMSEIFVFCVCQSLKCSNEKLVWMISNCFSSGTAATSCLSSSANPSSMMESSSMSFNSSFSSYGGSVMIMFRLILSCCVLFCLVDYLGYLCVVMMLSQFRLLLVMCFVVCFVYHRLKSVN